MAPAVSATLLAKVICALFSIVMFESSASIDPPYLIAELLMKLKLALCLTRMVDDSMAVDPIFQAELFINATLGLFSWISLVCEVH